MYKNCHSVENINVQCDLLNTNVNAHCVYLRHSGWRAFVDFRSVQATSAQLPAKKCDPSNSA